MIPGEIVADRFVIERLAGVGGMGSVYRAKDGRSGAPVALKTIRGEEDVEGIVRFVREAQTLARLSHSGIVGHIAHGRTSTGEMFLAMEWLDGESLSERLKRTGLTVEDSVAIAQRVAEALGVAHAQGVIHRDIKPGNIFLVGADVTQVKLLDFGLSRLRSAAGGDLTQTGAMIGTPGYMAPEQARGERQLDARADVFSLGCVLFRCLTGTRVYSGDVMAMLVKVVLEDPPRVRSIRPDVPAALDALVARMLAKRPDDRPRDASAVAEEIAALGRLTGAKPVEQPDVAPALTANERRVMCVLMAGAPGAPAAGAPPRLGGREQALRAAFAPHGGRLEPLANGSLLVTLDSGGAAADDASRAARCALAMRSVLADTPIVLVAGQGVLEGRVPIGEVIDRGVDLLAGAPPGGPVRLDQVVAGFLEGRFDVRADGSALVLIAEHDLAGGTRTLLGKPTPCVGRERDLSTLRAILDECVSEPVARAALVTAPAGVGKSRVRYEFLRTLQERDEAVEVWLGRGDPMSAGSPFDMIATAIRRAAGIRAGEPLELRQQKLHARVSRAVPAAEVRRVAEFVGEIIDTRFPEEGSVQVRAARQDPQLMGDQMRRAWEDWLAAETARHPVLLVLEDLHWGDLPSVKFVDAALRHLANRPFMVLALARPEVHELFPKLWAERDLAELRLGRLTKKLSAKLVREVLGDAVGEETLGRMVERANGNAFYLEEIIRAVAGGGGEELPGTVLAMVQARLEGLHVEARRLLRAASVFGKVFWRSGLFALLGGGDGPTLHDDWFKGLIDGEVITARAESQFPGEEEFAFHHALVHEAAYSMLTEEDRRLGHRLAGEWLVKRGEGKAVVLAEHFERGGDPQRAMGWYLRAAEQALEGNDLEAALARARKGIACGAEGDTLGALEMVLAEAHHWRAETAESLEHGLRAMSLLPRASPLWYGAFGEVAEASSRVGQRDRLELLVREICEIGEAPHAEPMRAVAAVRLAMPLLFAGRMDLADRLLELVARLEGRLTADDPAVLARIHEGYGTRALYRGDPGEYLRRSAAAAASFEAAGNLRSACRQQVNGGCVSVEIGAYEEAERALRGALAASQRMGLSAVAAAARNNLGLALARLGALEEARQIEREAIAAAVAQRDRRLEAGSRTYLAHILALRGDLAGAEREALAAVDLLSVAPPLKAPALAILGSVRLALGRSVDGLAAAKEAMDLLESLGGLEEGESFVRLVYAEALDAVALAIPAREAIRAARDRLLERAAKISDPTWRESFLRRVPENARTLALAAAWLA